MVRENGGKGKVRHWDMSRMGRWQTDPWAQAKGLGKARERPWPRSAEKGHAAGDTTTPVFSPSGAVLPQVYAMNDAPRGIAGIPKNFASDCATS